MEALGSPLWRRLEAFPLDDPHAALTFTQRLARENDWSAGYAARVVAEYKRFVFLAMTAGHEVTPSDQVDQAWHLHLTYTRSYWDEMCRDVLGRPLHHGPTRGGPAEGMRFEDQYERTLRAYREAFGEAAPPDIWPPSAIRFGEDVRFRRVNVARAWVVPRPRLPGPRRGRSALTGVTLVVLPAALLGLSNPLDFDGATFLRFYGILWLIVLPLALVLRWALRRSARPSPPAPPPTPEQLAFLSGGARRAVHASLAALVAAGRIEVVQPARRGIGGLLRGAPEPRIAARGARGATELESAILDAAGRDGGSPLSFVLTHGLRVATSLAPPLRAAGLLESTYALLPARVLPLGLVGAVWLLGVAKAIVGVARDRPVGYLLIALVVGFLVLVGFASLPSRTPHGDRLLARERARNANLRKLRGAGPSAQHDVLLAAGLFGLAAVDGSAQKALRTALGKVPSSSGGTSSWGSGCGAGGCGGGGCGGGCGGCGGD